MRKVKAIPTILGVGSNTEGKINCETDLRIDGHFNGEIHCGATVTIGEQGDIKSNIIANEVIIAGKVTGDIQAQERLTILKNGQIDGNVHVTQLVIVEGGMLNGTSKMGRPSSAPVKEKNRKLAQQPEAG